MSVPVYILSYKSYIKSVAILPYSHTIYRKYCYSTKKFSIFENILLITVYHISHIQYIRSIVILPYSHIIYLIYRISKVLLFYQTLAHSKIAGTCIPYISYTIYQKRCYSTVLAYNISHIPYIRIIVILLETLAYLRIYCLYLLHVLIYRIFEVRAWLEHAARWGSKSLAEYNTLVCEETHMLYLLLHIGVCMRKQEKLCHRRDFLVLRLGGPIVLLHVKGFFWKIVLHGGVF